MVHGLLPRERLRSVALIQLIRHKLSALYLLTSLGVLGISPFCFAAAELQKITLAYASLTGAYTPIWITIDHRLGKKYGLELESVYIGRGIRPQQVLESRHVQYIASSGTRVVSSHLMGLTTAVIIASLTDSSGTSILSKPELTRLSDLRGKIVGVGRSGGLSDTVFKYVLAETYNYFAPRIQRFPTPSLDALKTSVDVVAAEHQHARTLDSRLLADLSFVEQIQNR